MNKVQRKPLITAETANNANQGHARANSVFPCHNYGVSTASKPRYISNPPFLIIHGDQDKLVPYHQSVLLKDALEKAGVPVTFYRVKGGGHGWFRDPKVPELTKAFLEQYLKPKQSR